MTTRKIAFKISRFKAEHIDPSRFFTYLLYVDEFMSVLDALEKIRLTKEPSLMYRHSCHHSSCGTCACRINDIEGLLCKTNVWALGTETVTLAPLKGFPRMGDLVVDMKPFFKDIDETWTCLQPSIRKVSGTESGTNQSHFTRFEDCIECGGCISACPVSSRNPDFIGPAALTAIHRELEKDTGKKNELLSKAKDKRGVSLCDRVLNCSRVCPTKVYPARHILLLQKMMPDS